ncbi:MAG: hypothetical protein WED34_04470 [Planctomycetales bacterium]
MTYAELLDLYFDRSNALQWYWTVYVVVLGGLLAFSSLRQGKDILTTVLVSVLYAAFAYKNLGAIRDVTEQRFAILEALRESANADVDVKPVRERIEPTLVGPADVDIRNFHVACDALTIATLWAMEFRRRRIAAQEPASIG